jgi:DNA-binding MarR family transcriptional regulator
MYKARAGGARLGFYQETMASELRRNGRPAHRVAGSEVSLGTPGGIDELLGYRLHVIVAKIASAVIRLCEGRYAISRREWHVLGLLDARGPQTPSQLAGSCHLDRPRVSRAVSALASKGLVSRARVAKDRKRAFVALTPSGRELHRRIFREVSAINARLIEGLDEARVNELHRLLAFLKEKADIVGREAASEVHADRWRGRGARPHWPTRPSE